MPAELPPRPGPPDKVLILARRPKSGFINYPPFFQKRMIDGRARFMTKCDMLIGPCACGFTHYEWEGWVLDTLQMYNCQVEMLILWGSKLGDRGMVVEVPGYWKQGRNWERPRCDVLVGQCTCGRTHATSERWVKNLLNKHRAVILNMPEVEASEPDPERASRSRSRSRSRSQTRSRESRSRAPNISQWVEDSTNRIDADQAVEELVTDVIAGRLALPTGLQEQMDNNSSGMQGCDCSDCEGRRERDLVGTARTWIQDSLAMSQAPPSQVRSEWECRNCNDVGQLPGWCNCDSCLETRLHRLNAEAASGETVAVEAAVESPRWFEPLGSSI